MTEQDKLLERGRDCLSILRHYCYRRARYPGAYPEGDS